MPDWCLVGAWLPALAEVGKADAVAYAHLAPIWNPVSKDSTRTALGSDRLREACSKGLPIIAQGGLDPNRARVAIESGASGVAVTGSLT